MPQPRATGRRAGGLQIAHAHHCRPGLGSRRQTNWDGPPHYIYRSTLGPTNPSGPILRAHHLAAELAPELTGLFRACKTIDHVVDVVPPEGMGALAGRPSQTGTHDLLKPGGD